MAILKSTFGLEKVNHLYLFLCWLVMWGMCRLFLSAAAEAGEVLFVFGPLRNMPRKGEMIHEKWQLSSTYQPSIWMSWSQKLINVNLQLICIKKHFFYERSKSLKVKESQLAKPTVSKPLRCEAFVLGPEAELQVMKWGTPKRRHLRVCVLA